ncbi:GAP family protein [Streptomyces sp. NPDC001606]
MTQSAVPLSGSGRQLRTADTGQSAPERLSLGGAVGHAAVGGTGGASTHTHPATWVGALKLALGALLAVFGARQGQRRPKDATQAQLPKWMAAIDRFTPIKILGLALLFSAGNLKNAPLTIAAGASISSSGLPVPPADRNSRDLRGHRFPGGACTTRRLPGHG